MVVVSRTYGYGSRDQAEKRQQEPPHRAHLGQSQLLTVGPRGEAISF